MTGRPAEEFEQLVAEIFRAEGFTVRQQVRAADRMADIIIENYIGREAIVEVKLYRSRQVSIDTVTKALEQLEHVRLEFPRAIGILAMTADQSKAIQELANSRFPNAVICDYSALRAIAAKYDGLIDRFDEIIRQTSPSTDVREGVGPGTPIEIELREVQPARPRELSRAQTGREICTRLHLIKPGARQAALFENVCTEALKYIFDRDLVSWKTQSATDDRLHRYDLIARVSSNHDLWHLISKSFNSHYVVFEFKNYSEKIKQQQIYSTEKYLYTTALRSAAFIISRKGPDKNAVIAARGALREAGKLIVNLTVDQICEMLTLRDDGSEHNAVLVDLIDQMLMQLAR